MDTYTDITVDVEYAPPQPPSPPPPPPPLPLPPLLANLDYDDLESDLYPITEHNSTISIDAPLPVSSSPPQNRIRNLMKYVMGALLIIFVIATLTLLSLFIKAKHSHTDELVCVQKFHVSSDGKGDFRTVSEALDAAPSYSPFRICIILKSGLYNEIITVEPNKYNITLLGEGVEKTRLISNASMDVDIDTWMTATLSVNGHGFMARDLSIENIANSGVAVVSRADSSVFYKCKMRGSNSTLQVEGGQQFYRNCDFYGKNYLIRGYGDVYFQRCNLYGESLGYREKMVFVGQTNLVDYSTTAFTFHISHFQTSGHSKHTFIASGFDGSLSAKVIVMQSYLDASITGYIVQNSTANDFVATFDNSGPGTNMTDVPNSVHEMKNIDDTSEFTLRFFLDGRKWIPPGVDYELDVRSADSPER